MNMYSILKNKIRIGKSKPKVLGNIDVFNKKILSGWIKVESQVESQEIDVYLNSNKIISKITADAERYDVKRAGFGTGRYGFQINLEDYSIFINENTKIVVKISDHDAIILSSSLHLESTLLKEDVKLDIDTSEEGFPATAKMPLLDSSPQYKVVIDNVSTSLLNGWAVYLPDPLRVFTLKIIIDGVEYSEVENTENPVEGITNNIGVFSKSFNLKSMEPGEHTVSVVAPDATFSMKTIQCGISRGPNLPPIIISGLGTAKSVNLWTSSAPKNLSVIVPIYNAKEDLKVCISRLALYTPCWVDILFINDASSDPEINEVLESTKIHPNMTVLQNNENIGYTETVNFGFEKTSTSDVIVLNSDARVTSGWIIGMQIAMQSRPNVGTVTAMSDRAGAFSAPSIGNNNPLPIGIDENTYSRAFRRRSLGLYPEVPTGNGFCMLISRACIEDVGKFDSDAFPRGYGEENDFCMRAGRAGWCNLIDDTTYIFHDRSKSFGANKASLLESGRKVVDRRYPEYELAIRVYQEGSDITLARFRAKQAQNDCLEGALKLTRILYVISTQSGGTPQTNYDLMKALDDAVDCWILRCDSKEIELSKLVDGEICAFKHHTLKEVVDPISHESNEYDAVVTEWLLHLDLDIMHIRHLGWHSLSLPRISKEMNVRVIFSFHDFYALCPTIKLIDAEQNFCGGKCTKGRLDCVGGLWPEGSLPPLRDNWVHVWRQRFWRALKDCDCFITTSHSARDYITNFFPEIIKKPFLVIPHGRDFEEFSSSLEMPNVYGKIRILIPGNIDTAKGLDVIEALAIHDKAGWLEFHVLGNVNMQGREPHPRIVLHGGYNRNNFSKRAIAIKAHVGAIFSIWDETYCHTLTELWSIGLPALVFDFPTVANRVRGSGAGWVLTYENVENLYEKIISLIFDHVEIQEKTAAVKTWQYGHGVRNTTSVMSSKYLDSYRKLLRPSIPRVLKIGVLCSKNSGSTFSHTSTQLRLHERTRNHVDRNINFIKVNYLSLIALVKNCEIDGVIIQNAVIPRPAINIFITTLKEKNIPYIFDIDIDIDMLIDKKNDSFLDNSDYNIYFRKLVNNAKAITVSTPYLAKKLSNENSQITVLPDFLSDRLWRKIPPNRSMDDVVRAIYIGDEMNDMDFHIIASALKEVEKNYDNFSLSFVGVVPELDGGIPSCINAVEVPKNEKTSEMFSRWLQSNSTQFDFAVVPINDAASYSSKYFLRFLEYGALGIPLITSKSIAYDGLNDKIPHVRFIDNNTEIWYKEMSEKISMGKNNRKNFRDTRDWILSNGMLDKTLPQYDELIKNLILSS